MRILHVVPTYFPAVRYGGPIHSVHGLCNALGAVGHDVHVFTTSVDGPGDLNVPLGQEVLIDRVKVHYFPSRYLRRLYWSASMRQELLAHMSGFDILHLHSIFLWPTSAAARIARRQSVPYIVAPRGMLVKDLVRMRGRLQKSAWLQLVERRTLEEAASLHATSDQEAREMREFGYRLPGIEVVPNGVDLPAVRPAPSPTSPVLLFLGRINWKKGLDRLIPAMKWLPAVRLQVAGNDEEGLRPQLERLAQSHGVTDRVQFLGAVSGSRKEDLLRTASVLVLPSYNENFGNVILESLACGRPVAVTAEVGLAQAVEAAGAGRIIPGEPRAMARELADMLCDTQALDCMGGRGRTWVEECYSWPAVARQMEAVYQRVREGAPK